jgi:hypothetical protein
LDAFKVQVTLSIRILIGKCEHGKDVTINSYVTINEILTSVKRQQSEAKKKKKNN